MDFIVHPATGSIMTSRECVWLPAHALENIDTNDLVQLQDAMDQYAVPVDSAVHVVIAVGNPFDGLSLYGPFMTAEEAGDWADRNIDDTWQVVTPQTGIW